jgi:hypothetical protein
MTNVRLVFSTLVFALCVHPSAVAQTVSQYREYALESSLASVTKTSGTSEREARTLHERPARIQELEWRRPYSSAGLGRPDPVRHILFSFYNDQLYRMIVTYDRDRVEGLTNDDIVQSLTATYGVPQPPARAAVANLPRDSAVVAQWNGPASLLTLTRDIHSREVQLSLVSKALNPRARGAIAEAFRLDALEAPGRERVRRAQEIADARAAAQKAREANKAAFQP